MTALAMVLTAVAAHDLLDIADIPKYSYLYNGGQPQTSSRSDDQTIQKCPNTVLAALRLGDT